MGARSNDRDWLAQRFEEARPDLRAIAYRMLGSLSEADDALQEAWVRLDRADAQAIENLGGWLRTVVARVCLNMLRSRASRREEPFDIHVPEPIVSTQAAMDPEHEALLSDAVGLALLVVLDTLTPRERLAFVLHDMFAVPFDEIAPIVGSSPQAARALASRARRRVRRSAPTPDPDLTRQREIVDAFLAASRDGDFDALLAILAPHVVLRTDHGPGPPEVTGAPAVASGAATFARLQGPDLLTRPALVNGAAGLVAFREGRPFSVLAFTISNGKIARIDILADPDRLRQLDLDDLG